jgi:hypothetical protein
MVAGRIGNKLDSLALTIPETLLKVDMSRVQEWCQPVVLVVEYLSEAGWPEAFVVIVCMFGWNEVIPSMTSVRSLSSLTAYGIPQAKNQFITAVFIIVVTPTIFST